MFCGLRALYIRNVEDESPDQMRVSLGAAQIGRDGAANHLPAIRARQA
jgi:hypothetical protein